MYRSVKDMSPEERLVLEHLVGRRLRDDEVEHVNPLKEAPTGEERERAYRDLLALCDEIAARRPSNVSDEELDRLFDEASDHARHSS
jgi:hypothetical protein